MYQSCVHPASNCLPCCNIENSVEILDTDAASLLSSQLVMSGYVLTDVAAGIRIGIQGITDISLLPTLVQAINATLTKADLSQDLPEGPILPHPAAPTGR